MPEFKWVNTIVGNLKTLISGALKAIKLGKWASQYHRAIYYRCNERVNLRARLDKRLSQAATSSPIRNHEIWAKAVAHHRSEYRGLDNHLCEQSTKDFRLGGKLRAIHPRALPQPD